MVCLFWIDGSLSFFHLGSQTVPELELLPNSFPSENQGKQNNFLVLVSVAYTLASETQKLVKWQLDTQTICW